ASGRCLGSISPRHLRRDNGRNQMPDQTGIETPPDHPTAGRDSCRRLFALHLILVPLSPLLLPTGGDQCIVSISVDRNQLPGSLVSGPVAAVHSPLVYLLYESLLGVGECESPQCVIETNPSL